MNGKTQVLLVCCFFHIPLKRWSQHLLVFSFFLVKIFIISFFNLLLKWYNQIFGFFWTILGFYWEKSLEKVRKWKSRNKLLSHYFEKIFWIHFWNIPKYFSLKYREVRGSLNFKIRDIMCKLKVAQKFRPPPFTQFFS